MEIIKRNGDGDNDAMSIIQLYAYKDINLTLVLLVESLYFESFC